MPSHKEILQKNVVDTEREHQAASQEEARLRAEVEATSSKITDLGQRYDNACVQVAQANPKAENPASILAERDTHGHRLRGLEQMYREASQRSQTTAAKMVEAQTALQALSEQEELERLQEAVKTEKANVAAAEGTLREANQRLAAAKRAHSQFARKLDPSLRSCLNA